ncbi:integral membrane protein [Colletotrichum tabaci]|uniref:Integral membrane protein n=1 Tax=Colletotrichum tabaci TaxID=1209068 RepID=A0AAV9SY75_9PEZI
MSSPPVGSEAWKAQDKGPSILIVCWMATAISTVFVLSRIYVRGRIMGKFHSDDYFVLLGQMCGCIATALVTLAVKAGNGKHMTLLSTEQQQGAILWTTAAFCPDDTSDLVIWTIVEGSTIIIASSIPVLQPLLEPILKHSPFSSTKGSKEPSSYGYRSSNSNSRGGDIELGQRKPKKKPRDELGLTIIEGDSQENILTPSKQTWTLAPRLMHGGLSHPEPAQPADCRIVRTDEVTVSYEIQRQGQENTASRRWMPV